MTHRHFIRLITIFLLTGILSIQTSCQAKTPVLLSEVIYKRIDTVELTLQLNYPPEMLEGKEYPAIIFFYGGGFKGGTTTQFEPHARFFADRGMIGVRVDYRVSSRHGTTPFEAARDAKSAVRFIRQHAAEFHIDPNRIVASGGSAGGHLAAATGTLPGYDEENEDLMISSRPNALVLFNPVFDNGPEGYGYDRIGELYKEFSPAHNIRPGAPPTIIFLGTEDRLIPVSTAERYKKTMEDAGNRCELFVYEGQEHGFFNYKHPEYYRKTITEAARFLESLGYIEPLAIHDINRILLAKDLYSQGREPYKSEVEMLQEKADNLLKTVSFSVMDKKMMPPSGDKHDYYSLGIYWWPDQDKKDGLPYIRHDGKKNPEYGDYDGPAIHKMSEAVSLLALAWYYTGEMSYATKAAEFLRTWFLDPDTKMNPHLEYGQAIPGRTEGRGIGIIETGNLIDVVEAVGLLSGSGALKPGEEEDLKKWFKAYNRWLLTSQKGWDERMWRNNHGSSYDSQVATFSIFTGEDETARMILDSVKIKRIDRQFEADGSQPFELERTKAMGYSIYNLKHLYHNAILAEHFNIDLWTYENPKGASILTGTKYLIPFLTGEKEFPFQQYGGLESQKSNFLSLLRIAGDRFQDPEILKFLETYTETEKSSSFQNLLFPNF